MTSWKDSLLIGVKLIDDQHFELVRRIDQLIDACNHGDGQAEAGETLKFIVSYIKKHFKDEEELQALYAYPDMTEHKKLHEHFIATTIDLVQELKSGNITGFADKERKMLIGWLIKHIHTEDKKIGIHIHNVDKNKEKDKQPL